MRLVLPVNNFPLASLLLLGIRAILQTAKELLKQNVLDMHNAPFPAAGLLQARGGVGCSLSSPPMGMGQLQQLLPIPCHPELLQGWVRCYGAMHEICFHGVNSELARLTEASAGVQAQLLAWHWNASPVC